MWNRVTRPGRAYQPDDERVRPVMYGCESDAIPVTHQALIDMTCSGDTTPDNKYSVRSKYTN